MQKDCVDCHNERAESAKRDWKVGDVGGVLEIIRPLRGDRTLPLRDAFLLVGCIGGSLLGLAFLGIILQSRRGVRVTLPR